jgi:hypothetical protein
LCLVRKSCLFRPPAEFCKRTMTTVDPSLDTLTARLTSLELQPQISCARCPEFKHSKSLAQRHVGVARAVQVPRKKGGASAVTQELAQLAFVAGIEEITTRAVAVAEDERAAEGRYWLALMVETPHQNPQEFI